MSSINRGAVFAKVEVRLIGPDDLVVPLTASLCYSRQDPYAIRVSFETGMEAPVEWFLGRDLLAAALHSPEGIGDVRAWPSTAPAAPTVDGTGTGERILNIELGPLTECARFEVSAARIEVFLALTYDLVPVGQESADLDLDAELAQLLSQT